MFVDGSHEWGQDESGDCGRVATEEGSILISIRHGASTMATSIFFKQLRRAGVPPTQRVHFYLAAIRAVLEYVAPVWHHLLTKTQLDQLEAIQKRAIRILYQCNGITYANMLYFAQLSNLYANMLYFAQLSNLSRRREELCRRFFNSITQPDSCLHTPPTSTRSCNSYPTQSCCKVSSNNYPN